MGKKRSTSDRDDDGDDIRALDDIVVVVVVSASTINNTISCFRGVGCRGMTVMGHILGAGVR